MPLPPALQLHLAGCFVGIMLNWLQQQRTALDLAIADIVFSSKLEVMMSCLGCMSGVHVWGASISVDSCGSHFQQPRVIPQLVRVFALQSNHHTNDILGVQL